MERFVKIGKGLQINFLLCNHYLATSIKKSYLVQHNHWYCLKIVKGFRCKKHGIPTMTCTSNYYKS